MPTAPTVIINEFELPAVVDRVTYVSTGKRDNEVAYTVRPENKG